MLLPGPKPSQSACQLLIINWPVIACSVIYILVYGYWSLTERVLYFIPKVWCFEIHGSVVDLTVIPGS